MANYQSFRESKATGYIIAKQNNVEIFNTTEVRTSDVNGLILIRGFMNFGLADQRYIALLIEPSTPSGPQEFVRGEKLRDVEYNNNEDTSFAVAGTFNADLDNVTKKYQLSFKLKFGGYIDEIEGELAVTG